MEIFSVCIWSKTPYISTYSSLQKHDLYIPQKITQIGRILPVIWISDFYTFTIPTSSKHSLIFLTLQLPKSNFLSELYICQVAFFWLQVRQLAVPRHWATSVDLTRSHRAHWDPHPNRPGPTDLQQVTLWSRARQGGSVAGVQDPPCQWRSLSTHWIELEFTVTMADTGPVCRGPDR